MNRPLLAISLVCLLAILMSVPMVVGGMAGADWLPPTPSEGFPGAEANFTGNPQPSQTAKAAPVIDVPTATATVVLAIVTGQWNCRTAPAIDSDVVSKLLDGDLVEPGELRDGWVRLNDRGCWVVQVALSRK